MIYTAAGINLGLVVAPALLRNKYLQRPARLRLHMQLCSSSAPPSWLQWQWAVQRAMMLPLPPPPPPLASSSSDSEDSGIGEPGLQVEKFASEAEEAVCPSSPTSLDLNQRMAALRLQLLNSRFLKSERASARQRRSDANLQRRMAAVIKIESDDESHSQVERRASAGHATLDQVIARSSRPRLSLPSMKAKAEVLDAGDAGSTVPSTRRRRPRGGRRRKWPKIRQASMVMAASVNCKGRAKGISKGKGRSCVGKGKGKSNGKDQGRVIPKWVKRSLPPPIRWDPPPPKVARPSCRPRPSSSSKSITITLNL